MIDPREYAAAETLKGGLAVTIRALRPDDRERVAQAVRQLDRASIYLRLFSYRKELTEAGLDRIMAFDPRREVVLLATIGDGERETVIGSGRYVVTDPHTAEIAFVVEEDYHGRGIAGRLLRHLALVARGQGITTFEAEVLAENKAMQAVFERTGWATRKRREGEVMHVTMTLPDSAG
jgi:RimJ/RimL family protein N-acetyltransferase